MRLVFLSLTFLALVLSADGKVVQLHGAGASFPSEVYSRWIAAYKQYRAPHVTLNMTYNSIGSGAGKQLVKGKKSSNPPVNYVGSDIPLTAEEQRQFPDLKAFPVMTGAVAVAFNIKGVEHLNLSIDALTGIYNGSIRYWNHTTLQDLNHWLPNQHIVVVARSDNSGTTHYFTSALSAASATWEEEYGAFSEGLDSDDLPIKWNQSAIHFYGYGNRGMSGLILSLPYSIGYTTLADVYYSKLKYAMIQNSAGNFVEANTETVQNASLDSGGGQSLLNPPGAFSYPIVAYTFFIMKQTQTVDCDSIIEFVGYVDWFYTSTSAQTECENLYMVPIEPRVAANITRIFLQSLTCQGENVWSLYQVQKHLEAEKLASDYTSLYVSLSGLIVPVFVCAFIAGRRKWINYKEIMKDRWFIQFSKIHFERHDINKVLLQRTPSRYDSSNAAIQSMNEQYTWETDNIKLGVFNSDLVFLTRSYTELQTKSLNVKKTILWFVDTIDHVNVARLAGLTKLSIRWFSIYKGQIRGLIMDIIRSPAIKISTSGLVVLCKEIIQGMEYLHKKNITHGSLRSSCCLVDMTWKVKVTGWHEAKLRSCTKREDLSRYNFKHKSNKEDIIALFWVAPELIKFKRSSTQEGDVYSFGIVMQELFSKSDPYSEITLPPEDIVVSIISHSIRPKFPENISTFLRTLMDKTWELDPAARPTFSMLRQFMQDTYPNNNSLTDCIMKSVEEYASFLERQLTETKTETANVKEALNAVLQDSVPSPVADRILSNTLNPSCYQSGTILACSFVTMSQFISPFSVNDAISTLEEILVEIDQMAAANNVIKLSVNGENLLFGSHPESQIENQIKNLSTFAILLMNQMERISSKTSAGCSLQIKIGIAIGPVLVGIIGKTVPKYIVVGEGVSLAFRMLSGAKPRTIRLSNKAHGIIKQRSLWATRVLKDDCKVC